MARSTWLSAEAGVVYGHSFHCHSFPVQLSIYIKWDINLLRLHLHNQRENKLTWHILFHSSTRLAQLVMNHWKCRITLNANVPIRVDKRRHQRGILLPRMFHMLYREPRHAEPELSIANARRTSMLKLMMELAAVSAEMENLNAGSDMKEKKDSPSAIKGLSFVEENFGLLFLFLFCFKMHQTTRMQSAALSLRHLFIEQRTVSRQKWKDQTRISETEMKQLEVEPIVEIQLQRKSKLQIFMTFWRSFLKQLSVIHFYCDI